MNPGSPDREIRPTRDPCQPQLPLGGMPRSVPSSQVVEPRSACHRPNVGTGVPRSQTSGGRGESGLTRVALASIHLGQDQARLVLVLAGFVGVADLAGLLRLEENHLGDAFVGINLRGQRRRVADLNGHPAAPLGLQRCDVDDDAAAGVGALAHADHQDVARDVEGLHSLAQREAVGRDDHVVLAGDVGVDGDEGAVIEVFWIDDRGPAIQGGVGKDLEERADADVVAVAGYAVGDPAGPLGRRAEGLDDELVSDLAVAEYRHVLFFLSTVSVHEMAV